MPPASPNDLDLPHARRWPAAVAWVLCWVCLFLIDERAGLANMALVLVLAAAAAALWSGPWTTVLASAASVLAFNFFFVPPRGALTVDLHQHALLLTTMLAVSWIVALLVSRLRWHAAQAQRSAGRSDQLRRLGEALRAEELPQAQASALQAELARLAESSAVLWVAADPDGGGPIGETSADEAAGLRLCVQEARALGPGTGRHEDQAGVYVPLRGLRGTHGAALLRRPRGAPVSASDADHAQALCDQLGAALERGSVMRAAAAARDEAQAAALRSTLLTAISHDHRTPLATILAAGSALLEQGDRLSPAQRRQHAAAIVDEATQLSRLTDNTLQLARLGMAGLALQRDWESVEELVGTVLRRVRRRSADRRITARVEPGLPLLHCDAVLIVQLLDNLLDNALQHGGDAGPVEVLAQRRADAVIVAVRDRGPGVPREQRECIFQVFHRAVDDPAGGRRGAGVGLALCRAIAQVHGGQLRLRPRGHGGSSFELLLPVQRTPDDLPPQETPPETPP